MTILEIILAIFVFIGYSRLKSNDRQISTLRKEVSILKQRTSILNSELQMSNDRVKGMKQKISELKDAYGQFRTRLADLKRDFILNGKFVENHSEE